MSTFNAVGHTWQDSGAGYTFQQSVEPSLRNIQTLELLPNLIGVFEHIAQDAPELPLRRRRYKLQNFLHPTCNTVNYLCLFISAERDCGERKSKTAESNLGGQAVR